MEKMYPHLLATHSVMRWLVLIVLLIIIFVSYSGKNAKTPNYRKGDQTLRTLAVILVHTQLVIGLILYIISPTVNAWMNGASGGEGSFFGIVHALGMITAAVLVTVASAKARRATDDRDKFRIQFNLIGAALVVIFLVIPWPGSPLAERPLMRSFGKPAPVEQPVEPALEEPAAQ